MGRRGITCSASKQGNLLYDYKGHSKFSGDYAWSPSMRRMLRRSERDKLRNGRIVVVFCAKEATVQEEGSLIFWTGWTKLPLRQITAYCSKQPGPWQISLMQRYRRLCLSWQKPGAGSARRQR